MREVAIIGAGELGGACAHALARLDVARTITLVDDKGRVAAGKALDIAQAAPVEGFATQMGGATELSAVSAADLVVIADRFSGGEWQGEDALALLMRLSQISNRGTIVVCAGSTAREAVERGVVELKLSRQRLFGTAPEALGAAARAIVALTARCSPQEVALSVLGVPPAHLVVAWGDATVGGFAATATLSEPTRRMLDAKIRRLWPPGPYALAAAAAKAIAAIGGRSRRSIVCFVAPDRSAGERTRTGALPVSLGSTGVQEVRLPTLSAIEKVALENAMML